MIINSPLLMQRRRKKGFTLTEIAIVLGIIGLILGSIWVAASSVYSNVKTANAQRAILATAQAVRAMYVASNGNTGVTTATLITAPGMLPLDYTSSTWYVNPWNLASTVSTSYVVGSGTSFAVELDGISNAACVSLLNAFSNAASATTGNGNITGLVGNNGSNNSGAYTGSNTTPKLGLAGSISTTYVTTVGATCGSTGTSNVAITFNMSNM